jgi:hypothetical protein
VFRTKGNVKSKAAMKNQLMIVFFAALLFGACENKQIEKEPAVDIIEATVKADESKYRSLLQGRESYEGEVFDLKKVEREGHLLRLFVEGPCDTEGYSVTWDGVINFSEPAMANLAVGYTAKSQIQCLAIMAYTIEVDLQKAFGKNYPENLIVNVINASKKQDVRIDDKGTATKLN